MIIFLQIYLTDQLKEEKLFWKVQNEKKIILQFCLERIYIDWGDKWFNSFDDNVVPLAGRRNWVTVGSKWPRCIALLIASVNDENDATVWMGLFVGGRSVPVVDFVVEEYNVDDEVNAFGWSDKCFKFANGVQRIGFCSVGVVAKEDK